MSDTNRRDKNDKKIPETKHKKTVYICKCEYCQYLARQKIREKEARKQIEEIG